VKPAGGWGTYRASTTSGAIVTVTIPAPSDHGDASKVETFREKIDAPATIYGTETVDLTDSQQKLPAVNVSIVQRGGNTTTVAHAGHTVKDWTVGLSGEPYVDQDDISTYNEGIDLVRRLGEFPPTYLPGSKTSQLVTMPGSMSAPQSVFLNGQRMTLAKQGSAPSKPATSSTPETPAPTTAAHHTSGRDEQSDTSPTETHTQPTTIDTEQHSDTDSGETAPKYGYQCQPGDADKYAVCAGHEKWVNGQREYMHCINSGGDWDIKSQSCKD
jgi:hypothetical protein